VDRIIEILDSCHGFPYRDTILSYNSRLPVPVGLFVSVNKPIRRTCMTSRYLVVLKHFQTTVLMNSKNDLRIVYSKLNSTLEGVLYVDAVMNHDVT